MTDQVISRDTIRRQARRAAEAGIPVSHNPYTPGTSYAKRWLGAYLQAKQQKQHGRNHGRSGLSAASSV